MSSSFRTCNDGHRCENGALCAEAQEGSYYCDCSTASGGDFAGLSCEFEAENYCELPQETTSTWFCTNQGSCVYSGSFSCDCPTEYEGPHCEYIAGTLPDDWPGQSDSVSSPALSSDGLETGVMIAIIAVSVAVVLMLALLVVRSIRRRSPKDEDSSSFNKKVGQNAPKDQSEALNIDMDGSGFRDAVLTSGKSNSSSSAHFDFDTNGISVEVDTEAGRPQVAVNGKSSSNGNGHGTTNGNSNGHGFML